MGATSKSSVIILIVVILISLSLAGAGFYLFQKEHSLNLTLQEELEDLKGRVKIFEAKLQESKDAMAALEANLQAAQDQVGVLNNELEKERAEKKENLAQVEQLRSDLQKQKDLKDGLDKQLDAATKNAKGLQAQLKELEARKTELEAKMKDLEALVKQPQAQKPQEQGVELGKIVVSPEGAAEKPKAQSSGVEGKVLVVNKDYNFAVINLGNKDGVEAGNIFSVYNNNKNIGLIKVDRVHDSMSAASFVSAEIKDKVKEGDKVVLKTQ